MPAGKRKVSEILLGAHKAYYCGKYRRNALSGTAFEPCPQGIKKYRMIYEERLCVAKQLRYVLFAHYRVTG